MPANAPSSGIPGGRWRPFLAASLCAALTLLTFPPQQPPPLRESGCALEVGLATSESGMAQLFVDRGEGFSQAQSFSIPVETRDEPVRIRFPLPAGRLGRLRLDYFNGICARARLESPRVIDLRSGETLREIPAALWKPSDQIAAITINGDGLEVRTQPGADDPWLIATLEPALHLGPKAPPLPARTVLRALGVFIAAWLAGLCIEHVLRTAAHGGRVARVADSLRRHPRIAIACSAAVGVIVCCHPVIFAGRSLFSPDFGLALLHPAHGTTQQAGTDGQYDVRGSDIGAALWQHLPYSIIQHRALAEEHTLPLWNRYNSCGVALFGQGQSMLGDPLHLPVILAGGATWAWDAKLVSARFLFACGAGLAGWAVCRRLGVSALIALSAPFIGYFSYRLNHPALITVGYSPWLLVAWLELTRASGVRAAGRWFVLIIAANACLLTSGTVKEAAMLAIVLNATGMLALALEKHHPRLKLRLLAAALALAVAGVLVAAPWWTAFFHTLGASWTAYDVPYALRLPAARLAGLFDGMLYSEFFPERLVFAPSANFLVLLGVLLLAAQAGRVVRDGRIIAIALGLLICLSLAFDVAWLPERWILALPGLRSVGHVGNTFSCVALPLLLALATRGLATITEQHGRRGRDVALVTLAAIALLSPLAIDLARNLSAGLACGHGPLHIVAAHAYFLGSLVAMLVAWAALLTAAGWLASRAHRERAAGFVLAAAALVPLLARHGQVTDAGHDSFFARPGTRAELATPSPALCWTKSHAAEPFRFVGLSDHVVPGFAAIHGIESPNGPDALVHRAYRELTEAAGLARPGDWYFPTDPAAIAPRQRILDLLNVRYYATCAASATPPAWLQPVHSSDLTILESGSAWPRAFFVDRATPCESADDLVRLITTGDGRPFAALHPADLSADEATTPPLGTHTIVPASQYHWTTQSTEFVIEAPGPGFVVLTEAWVPGAFSATINGRPVATVTVNHAFVAVRLVQAGAHRIRFEARHPAPALAAMLAAIGAVLAMGTLLSLRRHPGPPP